MDDHGLKEIINNVNKSELTPKEKVIVNIEIFKKAISSGVKTDLQVIGHPNSIDSVTGNVIWPPAEGYVVDSSGKAIKDVIVPKIGDTMDRYGSTYGTYTSPINGVNSYTFEQRALPYIENPNVYHKYEVIRDLSELKATIEN